MGMSSGIPFNSAGISSFSSSGAASRPPLASLGQQPPVPIQQGLETASPPILIDDSPTISSPFSSKYLKNYSNYLLSYLYSITHLKVIPESCQSHPKVISKSARVIPI